MFEIFIRNAKRDFKVWFVIPGAFIKGDSLFPMSTAGIGIHTVGLQHVTIHIGSGVMEAERLTIPVSQILAWGSDDETLNLLNLASVQ